MILHCYQIKQCFRRSRRSRHACRLAIAMPPKRSPAELGIVANESGAYRARIYLSRNIHGPCRGSQKRAFEDLMIIRAAAAEHTTRMGALQAMQQAAARLKEAAAAEAGGIFAAGDANRARIQYTDNNGSPKEIYGPRRYNERHAQADLERIRAAGAGKPTRETSLEAMAKEAQLLQEHATFEVEAGGIIAVGDVHRARIQYTDNAGSPKDIYGPRRYNERRAQADLERIRAAGAGKPTHEMSLEAMANEAQVLKEHAAFEVEVAIAIGQEQFDQQHMQTDSETDTDDGPFPDYDVSTRAAVQRLLAKPDAIRNRSEQPLPTTILEATKQLVQFRPAKGDVATLRTILEARADPNVVVKDGDTSPLRTVLWSAMPWDVVEMRQLLLDHGAKESRDDLDRWRRRRAYEAIEPAYLRNRHRDDREG